MQVAPQDLQSRQFHAGPMVELALCCLGEQRLQVVTKLLKLKVIVHLSMSWMWRMVTSKQCRPVLYASVICIIVVGVYFLSVRNSPQFIQVQQVQSTHTFLPKTLKYSNPNHNDQEVVLPGRTTTTNPFLSSKG